MDYVTESEALADMYDAIDDVDDFTPYNDLEKKLYLLEKSKFPPTAKGKYIIVQKPRYKTNLISRLYLVDRNITKRFWWSMDTKYAMLFESIDAAKKVANRYKYNNCKVFQV